MDRQKLFARDLLAAIKRGDNEAVNKLTSSGVHPNIKDSLSMEILEKAACYTNAEVVRYLVEDANFPVDLCNKLGLTALMVAASYAQQEIVQYLVSAGANLQAKNELGETALHYAANCSSLKVFKILQQAGIPVGSQDIRGRTVLHHAAERGLPDIVEYILEGGWLPVDCRDKYGQTPLMLTAGYPPDDKFTYRYADCVDSEDLVNRVLKLLIAAGADPGVKDLIGRTALHRALINSNNFKYLLERYPDFADGCDKKGQTAIMRALSVYYYSQDVPDVMQIMLKSGVDANFCDRDGRRALCVAVETDNYQLVEPLIDGGVTLSMYGKDVLTQILHMAVENEKYEVVKKLLAEAADVNGRRRAKPMDSISTEHKHTSRCLKSRNFYCYGVRLVNNELCGQSPLFAALRFEKMVKILIDAGADVNFKDDYGCSPLHVAISEEFYNVMEMLLDAGANPNVPDKCGVTPLHLLAGKLMIELIWGNEFDSSTDPDDPDKFDATRRARLDEEGANSMMTFIERLIRDGAKVNVVDCEGRTPLHYAAAVGNFKCLELLISSGWNVDSTDCYGVTPLLMAGPHSFMRVLNILIDAGADLNKKHTNGKTILHLAFENGDMNAIKCLLDRYKSVGVCDIEGNNILHYCVRGSENGMKSLQYVLEKKLIPVDEKNNEGQTALNLAVQLKEHYPKKKHLVERLLAAGANPSAKDNKGKTLLHISIEVEDVKTAEQLIASGADLTMKDAIGQLPLHCAAKVSKIEFLELLMNAGSRQPGAWAEESGRGDCALSTPGADVAGSIGLPPQNVAGLSVQDNSGKTALQAAVDCGNFTATKFLWTAGANFSLAQRESCIRALHLSIREGDLELMEHLISLGLDLSSCWWDPEHKTTLLHSAAQSRLEMLKYVLNMGKPANDMDSDGHTALHCAVLSSNAVGVKYLLEKAHVPVDQRDRNGRTSLILIAASTDWRLQTVTMTDILIAAGADVNAQDYEGKTAYQLAVQSGFVELLDILDMEQFLI